MTVSFDLDETLFVNPQKVNTEPAPKFPFNLIYKDRLRAGSVELLRYINNSNVNLWIYTTSFRTEKYIRSFFRLYKIRIDNIINGERHQKEVQGQKLSPMPSKYPAKYHIDLHIDDELSVYQNGIAYGFRVLIVSENDSLWTEKIKKEINRLNK